MTDMQKGDRVIVSVPPRRRPYAGTITGESNDCHCWIVRKDGVKYPQAVSKSFCRPEPDMGGDREVTFKETERRIVDYFDASGCDVVQMNLEWFISLYDEGPSISLTALAVALSPAERPDVEKTGEGQS